MAGAARSVVRLSASVAAALCVLAASGAAAAASRSFHRHRAAPSVSSDPASFCEAAIRRAEDRYGTPPALLRSIGLVETGRPDRTGWHPWPWSVDVDGAPFFFPTRDAAVGFTRTALLAGARSVDVGCMQVNLETHPDAFATLEDGFDPAVNVDYAARFLLALHEGPAHSVWATAVGFYHSQTEALASPYRARVIAIDDTLLPPGAPSLATGGNEDAAAAARRADTPEARMKKAWAATMVAENGDGP